MSVSYLFRLLMGLMFLGLSMELTLAAGLDDETQVPAALQITVAHDLAALAKKSRDNGVPILLMFSTEDCVFCMRLENEVLGPLKVGGIDPQRVILRKVLMEDDVMLNDFQGNKLSGKELAMQYNVKVIPTIVLTNAEGVELVPKIVGYQTPGFYESYLDNAINTSLQLIRQ